MRLAQLARKISRTQSDLLEFFRQNGINEYDNLNSKISEDHIHLALRKLAPHFLEEDSLPDSTRSGKKDSHLDKEHGEQGETDSVQDPSDLFPGDPGENTDDESSDRIIEKISIPKPKLEGVKVVGKINLPEPRVKVEKNKTQVNEEKEESATQDTSGLKSTNKKKKTSNRGKERRKASRRNTPAGKDKVSYREKLRKEKQKREERKRQIKKKEKEKKRKHYEKHIQSKIQSKTSNRPTSAKKKISNEQHSKPEAPRYNNPLRRFWAWLNGKYDRY